MADRAKLFAKLFKTGGSQAVRLPRAYRFEGRTEILIRRVRGLRAETWR